MQRVGRRVQARTRSTKAVPAKSPNWSHTHYSTREYSMTQCGSIRSIGTVLVSTSETSRRKPSIKSNSGLPYQYFQTTILTVVEFLSPTTCQFTSMGIRHVFESFDRPPNSLLRFRTHRAGPIYNVRHSGRRYTCQSSNVADCGPTGRQCFAPSAKNKEMRGKRRLLPRAFFYQ